MPAQGWVLRFSVGAMIVIATVALLCHHGTFYMTGAQYYDVCWLKAHSKNRAAESPMEAALWDTCDEAAIAALYTAGYIFSGNAEYAVSQQLKAIQVACPNAFREVPLDGPWQMAVNLVQQSGRPHLVDNLMPASSMIIRVFNERWPNCPSIARDNGFPRLVKRRGAWDYETECIPCRAEQRAIEEHNRSNERGVDIDELLEDRALEDSDSAEPR